MTLMIKLGALAVTAALCALVVKKNVQELGLVLALLAGAMILTQVMGELESVRALLNSLAEAGGISDAVLSPVVKTVGISIITRLTSEMCRDAKEGGIAAFVEIAGAVTALFVAVPLIKTVLSMIMGLL
jgi:stage III sporulation protein AD